GRVRPNGLGAPPRGGGARRAASVLHRQPVAGARAHPAGGRPRGARAVAAGPALARRRFGARVACAAGWLAGGRRGPAGPLSRLYLGPAPAPAALTAR